MGGNLVAIGLLLTVGVTLYVVIRYARRPFRRNWVALLLGVAAWAILMSLLFPTLMRGQDMLSLQVLAIPSFCALLALVTPIHSLRVYLGLLVFTVGMFIAIYSYSAAVVDSGEYTGVFFTRTSIRPSAPVALRKMADANTRVYPAGWLRNMPFADKLSERAFVGFRITPHPLWHSRLTGLYRRKAIQGEVWYPGGKLMDAWHKLEIRPRTSSSAREGN